MKNKEILQSHGLGILSLPKDHWTEKKKKKSEIELKDLLVLLCAWALDGTQEQRQRDSEWT